MKLTRALAASGVLTLALTAAACGTTDSDNGAPSSDVPTSNAAGCDGDIATSTDPVSLTDGLGRTVELDKPARRVAVLEWQEIEDAISLCVDPVAVATINPSPETLSITVPLALYSIDNTRAPVISRVTTMSFSANILQAS